MPHPFLSAPPPRDRARERCVYFPNRLFYIAEYAQPAVRDRVASPEIIFGWGVPARQNEGIGSGVPARLSAMAFGGKAISQQRMEKDRLDELRREIQTLEGRDLPLWGTGLLLVLVVVAGFAALILPNLEGGFRALRADGRYLPQLLFGLMALIILFNIYYLEQRRVLRHTREDLLRQLVRSEAAERLSLVDPLTEIFNRRYLEEIVAKETSRADRQGGTLTFLMIDVDDFKMVNTRYGHLVGDRVLKEVALLLKTTFRPSDVIIRYGGDEFLVLLPGTDEQQAQRAVERLRENVDHWNKANAGLKYKMGLSCGMAAYTKGAETAEVLETADRRMYLQKPRKVATG